MQINFISVEMPRKMNIFLLKILFFKSKIKNNTLIIKILNYYVNKKGKNIRKKFAGLVKKYDFCSPKFKREII